MGKCLGFFALSQYLADELSAAEQQRVSEHLEGCEACQALRQQIEQDQSAYAELGQQHYNAAWQQVVAQEAQQAQQAQETGRRGFSALWKILIPVTAAAAAALLVALFVPGLLSPPPEPTAYRGYKGALSLQIVAKRKARQFVVSDGARLCPGDALRFSVTAGSDKPQHLVIFSLDRANVLSPFYPNETTPARFLARSGETIELTSKGRHLLPGSIVLDRSQGREVIVMLAAPRPFDPRPLQARVRKLFKQDPRSLEGLGAKQLDFAGTVRAVVIVKGPCS